MSGPADDERDAKDLSPAENADLCSGCVRCCTYITVEVDAPRAAWEYDQWIWALHHEGIEMFVERPESWFLHVATKCRQLQPSGRCSIHGRHPVLCREYDPRSCERRLPLADQRAWFHDAYELEAWLQRERPAHWKRLMAYRKDRVTADAAASSSPGPAFEAGRLAGNGAMSGGLIPLLSLGGRGSRGRTRV